MRDAALLVAPSRRRRAVEVRQLGRHVAAGTVPHRALLLDPRPYHYVSAARSLPGVVRRLARSGTRPDPRVGRFAAGEGLGWRLICLFLIRAPLQRARIKERLIEALSQTDEKSLEHIYNSILFALNKTRQ